MHCYLSLDHVFYSAGGTDDDVGPGFQPLNVDSNGSSTNTRVTVNLK